MRKWSRGVRGTRAVWLLLVVACTTPPAVDRPERAYSSFREALRLDALHLELPALAIAIVDRDSILFEEAMRRAPADGAAAEVAALEPLPADARFRAGSVSKMFTAMALLQLVEEGRLDLDAPVATALPGFAPANPFPTSPTVRQLLAHDSGLVREPPLGSYFDAATPSLAATVESLNATTLVDAPGTRTKYSNAAVSVAGRLLEVAGGAPFAEVMSERVLVPLGMADSAFGGDPSRLVPAAMWSFHGEPFAAPTFPFGIAPAASLETTLRDLAVAAQALLRGGRETGGVPLGAAAFAEMTRPQGPAGRHGAFGFGLWIDTFEGMRRIGHDGAVYGFTTQLTLLPEEGLGVVVLAAKDCVLPWVQRMTDEALRLARAARDGRAAPLLAERAEQPFPDRARCAGRWRQVDGHDVVELIVQRGELWLHDEGARIRVVRGGDGALRRDDPKRLFAPLTVSELPQGDLELEIDGTRYRREAAPRPRPAPPEWRKLLGEYGFDHNVLWIREVEGELHALVEWFFDYAVKPAGADRFDFPDFGLYQREALRFVRSANGEISGVEMAGVWFPRRAIEPPAGAPFRVTPTAPLADLMAQAAAATLPPALATARRSADLVDLAAFVPGLRFDVRYATEDNFLGAAVYASARAFLQRPAAEALRRVQEELARQGFGLIVHDGYRPWRVTKLFWEATPPELRAMVADPQQGSRHNRGCAVDASLCELTTGAPLPMPSSYDEFSARANPWYPGGSSEERFARDTLRRAFEAAGFAVHDHEWWHFDFEGWREWPVLDRTFEQLDGAR